MTTPESSQLLASDMDLDRAGFWDKLNMRIIRALLKFSEHVLPDWCA
jgi:hypothetical protein